MYLDKGFCSVPVLKTLARRRLSYILLVPVRGKSGGVRCLDQGRASYQTPHTLTRPQHGTHTVTTVVVRRYSKGTAGQHKASAGLCMPWRAYRRERAPRKSLNSIANALALKRVTVK